MRRTAAVDLAPALDVDAELTAAHAAAAPRSLPDARAATNRDAARQKLTFLRQTRDLDHRSFMYPDLRDQFLRPVQPEMRAIGDRDAPRLVGRAAGRGKDVASGAAGNRDPRRIVRHS